MRQSMEDKAMTNQPMPKDLWDKLTIVSRALGGIVVPAVVIVGSLIGYNIIQSERLSEIKIDPIKIEALNKVAMEDIQSIQTRVSTLERSLRDLPEDKLAGLEKAQLNESIQTLNQKVDRLGDIILESPEKALAIPLIRKEVEELNDKQRALAISVEGQIDRIYDFSKWFFGLMITLAIGLVTMGFVRRPRELNQPDSPE